MERTDLYERIDALSIHDYDDIQRNPFAILISRNFWMVFQRWPIANFSSKLVQKNFIQKSQLSQILAL